jgi:prepilin peptidase CpaA
VHPKGRSLFLRIGDYLQGLISEEEYLNTMVAYFFLMIVFPLLMICAMVNDVWSMRIPNWISIALVLSFFIFAPFSALSWKQIGVWSLTSFSALVFCFGAFVRGWIGGGDAKLIPATVLWLGPSSVINYLLLSSVFGIALLLFALVWRFFFPKPVFVTNDHWTMHLRKPKFSLPYGVALGASALVLCRDSVLWGLMF